MCMRSERNDDTRSTCTLSELDDECDRLVDPDKPVARNGILIPMEAEPPATTDKSLVVALVTAVYYTAKFGSFR